MTKVRIVAAVLDYSALVLYKEDGEKIEIPQGDARIKPIVDMATEPLSRGEVVEVDLEHVNDYQAFEQKTSGIVKFWRVAKDFVKHIFNPETDAPHEEPVSLGTVPVPAPVPVVPATVAASGDIQPTTAPSTTAPTASQVRDATPNQKPDMKTATDAIMANAIPVSDPSFKQSDTTDKDTMIATVGGKIIPGMENLQKQFAHAIKMGNTTGVTRFLERIAAVIDKRGHSIDDLLRFMERGDLPIADDGSIVAYKVLKSKSGRPGYYVDCHSGNVAQRIGSFVVMDESMVDPNRRNECSNGLHIARRGYLGGFSGDIIVLAKIAPEDVIAVPSYDANKVRVCGYHILGEIPKSEHGALRNNRPMTDNTEAKRLLTAALRGDHIARIEEVRITAQYGGGLKVTELLRGQKAQAPALPRAAQDAAAFDDKSSAISPVSAETVAKKAAEIKTGPGTMSDEEVTAQENIVSTVTPLVEAVPETEEPVAQPAPVPAPTPAPAPVEPTAPKAETPAKVNQGAANPLRQLFTEGNYAKVLELQKAKKKSLTALGFTDAEVSQIKAAPAQTAAQAVTPKPQESKKAAVKKTKGKGKPAHGQSVETKKVEETHSKTLNQQDRVSLLVDRLKGKVDDDSKAAYKELLALKKAAKKSWMVLGVSNFEALQAKFEK